MTLELDLPSPYKIFRREENNNFSYYEFTSDKGVNYYIHFDVCEYLEEFIDHGKVFYMSFGRKRKESFDIKIRETIICVLGFFFNTKENVLLYLCDTNDGKQLVRRRIFDSWYDLYAFSLNVDKIDEVIISDDEEYYTSMIVRKDNTFYNEYVTAFRKFHEGLSNEKNDNINETV